MLKTFRKLIEKEMICCVVGLILLIVVYVFGLFLVVMVDEVLMSD